MRKINAALAAFGMSGKVFHAPFINLHEGFNLMGAWERSKKLIEKAYPNARSYDSFDEILNDDNVELVVINTPTYTHYEYAKRALEAGKHVVVEKAFTTNVAEAQELKALAEAKNLQISVFQNRRWDSDFLTVKRVIDSGKLGELKTMELHYDRYALEPSYKIHKEEVNAGSGAVKDLGPHIIDQALVLFGMPQAVFADIRIIRPVSLVDDCFDILLYYPNLRVWVKSTLISKEFVPAFIAHGVNGSFLKSRADVQEVSLQNGMKPDAETYGIEPESEQGTINYLADDKDIREKVETERGNYMEYYNGVYRAITDNTPMPIGADAGINVMKIIEAAMRSQAEKRVIEL